MTVLVEQMMSQMLEHLRSITDVKGAELAPRCDGGMQELSDLVRGGPVSEAYVYDDSPETKELYRSLIDPEKVRHAQRFFATFGLQIGAALVYNALPDSYAAARGAQVLSLTGELVSNPGRRVRETTQFVLTLMTPQPHFGELEDAPTTLSPGQPGAIAARRMRIFHQAVRNFIDGSCTEKWDRRASYFKEVAPNGPALGRPINQEDLLGTLHEFSVGVFECLDVLGVPYSDDDKAAWFHVWDVVGCHMGVGTESAFENGGCDTSIADISIADPCKYFLPLDPKLSEATLAVIRRRHRMKSVEGTILVNALLAELQHPLPRGLKPLPASFMRYLLGNETANLLGISRGGWMQQWLLSMNSVPRIAQIVSRRRKGALVRLTTSELSAIATQQLLQSFVDEGRSGGRPFELSPQLENAWGLSSRSSLPQLPALGP